MLVRGPGEPGLGPAVDVDHQRQVAWALAERHRQVCIDGRPIACPKRHRVGVPDIADGYV